VVGHNRGVWSRLRAWRTVVTVGLAASLVVIGLSVAPTPASAMTVDTGTWYVLVNKHSGKALDLPGYSTANGTGLGQWSSNGGTNQQWQFVDSGGGYYRLGNRHSGKVVDVPGYSTVNGTQVVQWSSNGGTNQQFRLEDGDSGFVQLVNRNSGKCLSVSDWSTANGAAVIQWDCGGSSANQQWRLLPLGTVGSDPVLVGAGDIASSATGDSATAALLDTIAGTVFTTGDNAYPDGTASNYTDYYDPTWGRHKARTRPAPGNHDYHTTGATGYFGYFGSRAGPSGRGYYSYDLGNWHVVSLNSEVDMAVGSPQETWLRSDLAATTKPCTLAYWHKPLFTSGFDHGPDASTSPLFQALYDSDAEVVVTGHNHQYERFAPMNPSGVLDNANGVREFVAGMGGGPLYGFGTIQANSQARNSDTHGVLKFTLHDNSYDWQFVPEAGKTYDDSGTTACH